MYKLAVRVLLGTLALAGRIAAGEITIKGAEELKISGFTQVRYAYWTDVADSLVDNAIFVQRARVKLAARITARTSSELELDFASSRLVKDAMVMVEPWTALAIKAGQFKRSFSQEELFSSSESPVINLGLTNSLATGKLGYSGRSQGLAVNLAPARSKVQATLGVFTGAGEADLSRGDALNVRQTDVNNRGKDLAGRLAASLGDTSTSVTVAADASTRSVGGSYTDGSGVVHRTETFVAWGADAAVRSGRLTAWAEVMGGDNFSGFTDTASSFSTPSFLGWHIAAQWHWPFQSGGLISAFRPEARFEIFDPDTQDSDDGEQLITAGVALFLGKQMRWRIHAEWYNYDDARPSETHVISELQAKI